jgi:DNA topoisomerase VI subunit B
MCILSVAVSVQEVKHHPASVDLELIKRLIASTKCSTLQQFLYKEFSCISKDHAGMSAHA